MGKMAIDPAILEEQIKQILNSYGVPRTYAGYLYLVECLIIMNESGSSETFVLNKLYEKIADKYHVSVATVCNSVSNIVSNTTKDGARYTPKKLLLQAFDALKSWQLTHR